EFTEAPDAAQIARVARAATVEPQLAQRVGIAARRRHDHVEQAAAADAANRIGPRVQRRAAARVAASEINPRFVHRGDLENKKGHHLSTDDGPSELLSFCVGYIIRLALFRRGL